MADRFQNGLLLAPATAVQCGRTFSRWLVEFATQICGWTLIDVNAGTGSYVATKAIGTTGASVLAQPQRLTDATGTPFATALAGDYLTITSGMPPGFEDRHGIYRIARVIDDNNVELDIYYSVHDAGIPHPATGLNWRLWRADAASVPQGVATSWAVIQGTGVQQAATYNFQARILQQTGESHFPQFEVGPFANWNPATNVWDSPATTAFEQWYTSSVDYCRVWAVGDSDRIVVSIRMLDNTYSWSFMHLGEIDAFYDETIDPNPVVLWTGSSGSGDVDNLLGVANGGTTLLSGGGRMIGADDATTVVSYANMFCTGTSGNEPWVRGRQRRRSMRTRRTYRQSWVVESRTTALQEHRGKLRRCWICPDALLRAKAFGRNGEYLHIQGGVAIPWNGSGVHESRV